MAEFEGKDRSVTWFSHSVHPLFRKSAADRLREAIRRRAMTEQIRAASNPPAPKPPTPSLAEQLQAAWNPQAPQPAVSPSPPAPQPPTPSLAEQLQAAWNPQASQPAASPPPPAPQPAASPSPPVEQERKKVIDPFVSGIRGSIVDHVRQQMDAKGIRYDPDVVKYVTNHLMKVKDDPLLTYTYGNGASEPNLGWKLRLNTGRPLSLPPAEFEKNIIEFLNSQGYIGYRNHNKGQEVWPRSPEAPALGEFKYASGGSDEPDDGIFQNFTIYTGDRASSEALAEKLERQFGSQLSSKFFDTDTRFQPHVGARFVYDLQYPPKLRNASQFDIDQFGGRSSGGPTICNWAHPVFYPTRFSLEDAGRYHDIIWSLLSPDFYGLPAHPANQKTTKSMLSKKISWGTTISAPSPTHEESYPPQEAELEDILGSIGLGHLASQYREHLDGQERRGGAQGNHPLVMMSSSAYRRMLKHNEASHRARKTAREKETAAVPYAYDERGGSLGGESFKDGQGRKILVIRDFKPSDEPHEGGTAVALWPYPAGNGLVPVGMMHSHTPSAFSSQPSGSDINMIRMNHANAPIGLIMYPYGPGTEAAGAGFTDTADKGNRQPVRGSKEALDASAYGRTAHVRALFAELGPDGKPRVSTMDPRNIIVYDDRKGGYAFTPDGFGQGIHGPALVPGEHFTAGPETTKTGHLATPGGRAGSALMLHSPAIARTFGAGEGQIVSQQVSRETAKSMAELEGKDRRAVWFSHSVHPLFRKSAADRLR